MSTRDSHSLFAAAVGGPLCPAAQSIRKCAHDLHAGVNHFYSHTLPYGVHLDMVAGNVVRYADEVLAGPDDILPIYFGAYFHDSIEDARLTYNDVMTLARQYMDERQAVMATEIVYALTNEKGRTRAERAGERYYEGIRSTPYAPMVKLADRLANMSFSCSRTPDGATDSRMLGIYRAEMPHFIQSITSGSADRRLALPGAMLSAVMELTGESSSDQLPHAL